MVKRLFLKSTFELFVLCIHWSSAPGRTGAVSIAYAASPR
jgi:hypothetical protein